MIYGTKKTLFFIYFEKFSILEGMPMFFWYYVKNIKTAGPSLFQMVNEGIIYIYHTVDGLALTI